ncbi:MAG: universal stress protein [Syntrophobacteraceae bacterium]
MIPQIKNILFASDLTENSRHAFFYAALAAARYGADIVILHVVEALPTGMRYRLAMLGRDDTLQKLREAHEQEVRNILIGKKSDYNLIRNAIASYYGSAYPKGNQPAINLSDIIITEGEVATEILNTAKDHSCDLIIMGTHTGFLGATKVGSATKAVLQHAKVPVLVVPPPPPED